MSKMKKSVSVGSRVRLTGKYLRSTGQQAGSEGAKKWTVLSLRDDYAEVDEPSSYPWTAEELAEDPSLANRRINVGNLEVTA
jgi:hypothetical protein